MKTTKIETVGDAEILKATQDIVAAEGSQVKAAKKMKVGLAVLNAFINGYKQNAPKTIGAYFGLEQRPVYVRKNDNQNKA